MKKILITLSLMFNVGLIPGAAQAKGEILHGEAAQISTHCTAHFTRAETKYGIPKHLLLAIANTESGRYNHGLKRVLPWPWTLNIEGAGSYHGNMHDAITAVNRAKQRGQSSIDVGCMQVNLKHHPHAFTSVQDALTPAVNIDYAAKFLRSNFDELKSWPKAIAAYHSRSAKGAQYFAMVQKRWRDVRGIAGGDLLENTDYVAAKSETVNGVKVSRLAHNIVSERSFIRRLPEYSLSINDGGKVTTRNPAQQAMPSNAKRIDVTMGNNLQANNNSNNRHGMKVIKVSDSVATDNTTVTITPTALRQSSNSAQYSGAEQFVYNAKNTQQLANNMLDNNAPTSDAATEKTEPKNPNHRHQPNFIFGRN